MKGLLVFLFLAATGLFYSGLFAQAGSVDSASTAKGKHLYIDVHRMGPGKLSYEAVAEAHAKDLAVEKIYGVQFLRYWVDEAGGNVYCLSTAADSQSIRKTHAKDLAVEKKYAVNFINYWVDEKRGVVMCLSQAGDSTGVINTHKEAHGLLPAYIMKVKPNN